MSNVTTTFDTTEINNRVSDLKTQMASVQAKINEMNEAIKNAPLESATISELLKALALNLVRAHDKLESLVNELQSDIMEASGNLDVKTRSMEQRLSQ